jgi:ATP-dependent protease ClpP protease subunit
MPAPWLAAVTPENNRNNVPMTTIKLSRRTKEFALIGDVDDWEEDLVKGLLEVQPEAECIFYMDSAGGSVYGAVSVVCMVRIRRLKVTAVVLGECSSAALLVFGAAQKRYVTAYSTLLFHKMRWESEKRIDANEARQWSSHFAQLEGDLNAFQARLFSGKEALVEQWTRESRFLTGREVVEAGLAELLEFDR